ncbi:MAG: AEC family transporter, partial [Gammaproteobacteria bacterium]|nr:AEC family transporter [Gammaproteobacteria bacterium]
SNTVLLGIPLILTAFGEQASVPIFLIIYFHSFLLMPTVTTIIELGQGRGKSIGQLWLSTFKSLFTNPVILGLFAGMSFNLLNLPIPHAIDSVAQMLGAAATPGALFAMGASLSQYRVAGNLPAAGVLSVLKLVIHPLIVWLLAVFAFDIEPLWIAVAVVMAAMPTGVNMYLFAQRYKVAVAVATTTVLLCTALSIVTLSGLLFLLID